MDPTTLQQRRAAVLQQLQQAQTEATAWAQRAQQLHGQLLLLDELLAVDPPAAPPG